MKSNINVINPYFFKNDGTKISSVSFDSSAVYTADMQKKLATLDEDGATVIVAIPFNGSITGLELRNTGNATITTSAIVKASPFKCNNQRTKLYSKICYAVIKIGPDCFRKYNPDGTTDIYRMFVGFNINFSTLEWENQNYWELKIPDEAVGMNPQELIYHFEPFGEDGEDEAIVISYSDPISRDLEKIGSDSADIFVEPEVYHVRRRTTPQKRKPRRSSRCAN